MSYQVQFSVTEPMTSERLASMMTWPYMLTGGGAVVRVNFAPRVLTQEIEDSLESLLEMIRSIECVSIRVTALPEGGKEILFFRGAMH